MEQNTKAALQAGIIIGYAQQWQCADNGETTHTFDTKQSDAEERYSPEGWIKVGGVFPITGARVPSVGSMIHFVHAERHGSLVAASQHHTLEEAEQQAQSLADGHDARVFHGVILGASSGSGENRVEPVPLSVTDEAVERACMAMWPTWRNPHLQVDSDRERMREVLESAYLV